MIDDDPLYAAIQDGNVREVGKQLYPDLVPPEDDERQFTDAAAEIAEQLILLRDWAATRSFRSIPDGLEDILSTLVEAWEALDGDTFSVDSDFVQAFEAECDRLDTKASEEVSADPVAFAAANSVTATIKHLCQFVREFVEAEEEPSEPIPARGSR